MSVDGQIDAKLKDPIKELQQIHLEVGKIQTRLDLKDKADLRPKDFKRGLKELAATMKSAVDMHVPSSEDVKESIQQNLLKIDAKEPNYWPVVAHFISYRSQEQAPTSLRDELLNKTLPTCFGQGRVNKIGKDGHIIGTMEWSRCLVNLSDEFGPPGSAATYRRGDIWFKECLVRYGGGRVSDFVSLALFQDCIFLFSPDTAPSGQGELFSQFLLKTLPASIIRFQ